MAAMPLAGLISGREAFAATIVETWAYSYYFFNSFRIASPNSVIYNLFILMSKLDDFWLRDKMFDYLGMHDNITHEYIK